MILAEDFAAEGCHLSAFGLRKPPLPLECFWLFGWKPEHEGISAALRSRTDSMRVSF
jgi:hypothetical protein